MGNEEFPAVLRQIHFQKKDKQADPELDIQKTAFGKKLDVMEGIVGDGNHEKEGHAENQYVKTVQNALSGIAGMS